MILTRGIGVGGPLVTNGLAQGLGLELPQALFDYLRGAADERAYAARHDVSQRPYREIPEVVVHEERTTEELEASGEQPTVDSVRAPRRREPLEVGADLAKARAALADATAAGFAQAELAIENARRRARERALSRQRQRELELIALAAMADDED